MTHTPTGRTIQLRVAANRQPCAAPRCASARHGASQYCKSHKDANRAHGHPLGVRIFPKDYTRERREVAAILKQHPAHEGAKHALAWLDSLLAGSGPAPQEFARLATRGVTSQRILEEVAAVWMFAFRNERRLPDDARLTFALSTAVLHLAPRELRKQYTYSSYTNRRYVTAAKEDRKAIGEAIRQTLGLLLHNLALEPERAAYAARAAREALFAPFSQPTLTSKP